MECLPAGNETQLKGRDIAIDYLRAFVIVLVVFPHSVSPLLLAVPAHPLVLICRGRKEETL